MDFLFIRNERFFAKSFIANEWKREKCMDGVEKQINRLII